jgi:hypothetical protein
MIRRLDVDADQKLSYTEFIDAFKAPEPSTSTY